MTEPLLLKTERLLIREFQQNDWETLHEYGSDPDFSKFEFWGPNEVKDSKSFIRGAIEKANRNPRFEFEVAICLGGTGQHIGGCGIRLECEKSKVAHLGWAINPKFQNKGFATEAMHSLLTFAFENLGVLVAYATCDSRNIASYRVMEKLGMKKVGTKSGRKAKDGYTDEIRCECYSPCSSDK